MSPTRLWLLTESKYNVVHAQLTGKKRGMKQLSSTTISVILLIVAILSLLIATLQFLSVARPSLYAKVHGYPQYHMINLDGVTHDAPKVIQSNSTLGNESADIRMRGGVFRILLSNEGDFVARNVNIFVGRGIGLRSSRANKVEIFAGDAADLGDLRPSEEMEIIAWTRRSGHLFQHLDPEINISYDNGVVDIDKIYEIDGVLRFVHKHDLHLYFVTFLLPVILSGIAIMSFVAKVREARESGESEKDVENLAKDNSDN